MKPNTRMTAALAVALTTAISTTAFAVDWTGTDVTDGNNWHDTDNWGGNPIPGVGAEIGTEVEFALSHATDTIDLNGTSVSVGAFRVGADELTFADTGGTATITCTSMDFYWNNANHYDHHFYPDVVINGGFSQAQKNYRFYFHGALTAESMVGIQGGPVEVHGPLTVTDGNPVEIFFTTAAGLYRGGGQNYSLYDVLNCGAGVALNSFNPGSPVQMTANAATTLSGVTGTFDVGANSLLHLAVAQTTLPSGGIVVQPYGLLHGATGATTTWGPGNDIDVKTDAILAITSGTEPAIGDIGADVAWKAVTSSGTTTAGATGTTIYKGLAVAGTNVGASNSLTGHTLQSPVGAGDVEIMFLGGLNHQTSHNAAIESLDQTGIANLHMRFGLSAKGGSFNPAPNANSVTTFNFIGEGLDTASAANLYWNYQVKADQTYNFSGTGTVTIDPDNMKGQLTFSDTTMYNAFRDGNNGPFVNKVTAGYENTKLTFNDGAALAYDNSDLDVLELLDADQIVTSGTPILSLRTGGSNVPATISPQFNINAAETPNLIEFMKKSNINVQGGNNNYADLRGEGLIVSDGKYLVGYSNSHKGIYLRTDAYDATLNPYGPATISGVAGAATMGIACNSNNGNDYLGIIIPVDAKGAKLVLNNDQVMTTAMSGNQRSTEAPNNNVRLQGPITDTPEIDVRNGTIDFDPGVSVPAGVKLTVQSGATAKLDTTVTVGTVAGEGQVTNANNLTFSTVAPGNSVGALNLNTFTMTNGATYNCEISGNGGTPGGTPLDGTDNDVIDGDTVTFDTAWNLHLVNDGMAAGALNGSEVFQIIVASVGVVDFVAPTTITATGFDTTTIGVSVTQNSNVIEVTGLLVATGGTDPYETWASGALFDVDDNGDGVSNGLAWILGAATPAANALGKLPTVGTETGFLTLDFTRENPYAPAKLHVQYGNDLAGWTELEIPATSQTIGGDIQVEVTAGPPDAVKVKIPTTHESASGSLFARLRATEN